MNMKQSLLAVYNYATNNSYDIATEEQRSIGDLTTYKESTIYRIIFLLKAIADKYGKKKTVQQLMTSIRPFDLVPIACTGVAWTGNKRPNENVSWIIVHLIMKSIFANNPFLIRRIYTAV